MGKYYQLQCKRMLRSLPGIFLAMLVLIGSIALAYRLFVGQNALREQNNRFIFAICGNTDNSFLQMGISAFSTLDTSRFALDIREMDEPEAEQALSNTEVIVGTQTSATGAWTGVASFPELRDGQQMETMLQQESGASEQRIATFIHMKLTKGEADFTRAEWDVGCGEFRLYTTAKREGGGEQSHAFTNKPK